MKQIYPFILTKNKTPFVVVKYSKFSFTLDDGREIFDGQPGIGAFGLGYVNDELVDYVASKTKQEPYVKGNHHFTTPSVMELTEKLSDVYPKNITHLFYGTSGSDSVETAVKMVLTYWNECNLYNKKKFIIFDNSYHGTTISTILLSGLPLVGDIIKNTINNEWVIKTPQVKWGGMPTESEIDNIELVCISNLIKNIENTGAENIAALLIEPISFQGGVFKLSKKFFKSIREICDKYKIILIADDVLSGWGKLGTLVGTEALSLNADIHCNAKALTSGFFPLSITACNDEIGLVLEKNPFMHGWTLAPSLPGVHAAINTLHQISRDNWLNNVSVIENKCLELSKKLYIDGFIAGYRCVGTFIAIEMNAGTNKLAAEERLFKEGVRVTSWRGNTVIMRFVLPINITLSVIEEIFNRFKLSIR